MASSSQRDSSSRSKSPIQPAKPRKNKYPGTPKTEAARPKQSRPVPRGESGFQTQRSDRSIGRPEKRNPFRHDERPERGTSAPLHRPVAKSAVSALGSIMIYGRYADKVIEHAFKTEKSMGARDRKQFAEMVYELVRWYRRFGYAAGWDTEFEKPEAADLWPWLAAYLVERSVKRGDQPSLPKWEEFAGLNPLEIANRLSDLDGDESRAIHESVPDWFDRLGADELGKKWPSVLHAMNQPAPVVLRANTLKCTREKLIERLKEDNGVTAVPAFKTANGVVLSERQNVFRTEAFAQGWFEVQDGASQQVAEMLGAQPGERVIDACAGAGGKTLAIGAMMKNKGRLLSLDVDEKKLQELRRRVARAGIDTSEAKLIESAKTIKRLEGTADRVLLDVPCSGIGVLRRNPDKKWKLQPEELERLRGLQAQILREYSTMAKVGGVVVYATCSSLPSENNRQVEAFLADSPQFELVSERHFWPNEDSYDGFYAAVLKRLS